MGDHSNAGSIITIAGQLWKDFFFHRPLVTLIVSCTCGNSCVTPVFYATSDRHLPNSEIVT